MSSSSNLKDFVSTKIEREFTRRSTSGLTLWVLIGTLAFFINELVSYLPLMWESIDSATFFWVSFALNANIVYAVINLIACISPKIDYSRRMMTPQRKRHSKSIFLCYSFVLVFLVPSNIYAGYYAQDVWLSYLLYSLCVWYLFQFFVLFREDRRLRKNQSKIKSEHHVEAYYVDGSISSHGHIGALLAGSGVLLLSVIIWNFIDIRKILAQSVNYLLLTWHLVAVITICAILIYKMYDSMILNELIGLEGRIYLDDLSDEEIIEELIDNFYGRKVIDIIEAELDAIDKKLQQLNSQFKELDDLVDLNVQSPSNEMKTIVSQMKLRLNDELKKFFKEINSETSVLNIIIKQGPVTNDEATMIKKFNETLKKDRKKMCEILHKADRV